MKVKFAAFVLFCVLAVMLGYCVTIQTAENAQHADTTENTKHADNTVNAVNRHGTAVVFGDSYFNNPSVGYEFGDWLAENGQYEKVYNHAYGGSGWGNTFQHRQGYSLYELLISGTGTTPDGETAYEDIRRHVRKADVIYIHLGGNDFLSAASSIINDQILEEDNLRSKVTATLNEINRLNNHAAIYFVPPATMRQLANVTVTEMSLGDTDEDLLKRLKIVRDMYVGIAESDANVYIGEQTLGSLMYRRAEDGLHPTKEMANILFQQVMRMSYRNKLLHEMLVVLDETMTPDSAEKAWTKTVSKDLFDNTELYYIINNNGLWANSTRRTLHNNTLVWDVMTAFNESLVVGRFGWDDGITFTWNGILPLDE